MNFPGRKLGLAILSALALLVPMATGSQAAALRPTAPRVAVKASSALGYQVFGAQCVTIAGKKVCWPGATLGHYVAGSGKVITYQSAVVEDNWGGGTAGGNFCNWRIDWEYRDTNGAVYFTDWGPMHYTCEGLYYTIGRSDPKYRVVGKYGAVCAVLNTNGARVAAQCHFITA